MDSMSHTTVASHLLSYLEKEDGVTFDKKAFFYGNLKPDLSGEYLNRQTRHYPSLLFDDVMQRIRDFVAEFHIGAINGAKLSEELGVICHYITDFFTFPHNDDIYQHGLFAHYVYEKRTSFTIRRHIDDARFDRWAQPMQAQTSVEGLITAISEHHALYVAQGHHGIADDVHHICQMLVTVVRSLICVTCPQAVELPLPAVAAVCSA